VTPTDWALIVLAIVSVACLVLLVVRWQVNGFIALMLAAFAVGAGAVALGITAAGAARPLSMGDVVEIFAGGMGRTLGGIAAVIALGTMIGKLLAESGGAEVLAKRFAAWFGPERVVWCVMALALAVGLTTWFVVGLTLLTPILLTLTRETRRPFLALAIPLLACLSIMHGVMPPHPGPVAAMAAFRAQQPNMGLVLLWGAIIGLPTALVAGPLFARRAVRLVPVPVPAGGGPALAGSTSAPPFGLTLFAILLPVLLMLLDTAARLALSPDTALSRVLAFVGNPTVALLAGVLFGAWALGTRCGHTGRRVLKTTEDAVAAAGMVLMVVGAGGGFAAVLASAGVADVMGRLAAGAGLPLLVYGWLVAAFIRLATGSATVSIVTASGLLAPLLATHPETNVELTIVALGCGSLFLSLPNDGGFWIVKESLGMTVEQTLRTWTVTETLIGVAGLLITLAAHAAWQAVAL
jgi:GntP family gluconate:H+ symporter